MTWNTNFLDHATGLNTSSGFNPVVTSNTNFTMPNWLSQGSVGQLFNSFNKINFGNTGSQKGGFGGSSFGGSNFGGILQAGASLFGALAQSKAAQEQIKLGKKQLAAQQGAHRADWNAQRELLNARTAARGLRAADMMAGGSSIQGNPNYSPEQQAHAAASYEAAMRQYGGALYPDKYGPVSGMLGSYEDLSNLNYGSTKAPNNYESLANYQKDIPQEQIKQDNNPNRINHS